MRLFWLNAWKELNGERERERDRQTDRQTDRQKYTCWYRNQCSKSTVSVEYHRTNIAVV